MLSAKGIVRSKFDLLVRSKQQQRSKPNRFKSKKKLPGERTEEVQLLEKSNPVEMTTMSSLPPQWVDRYQECVAMLAEIADLKKEIFALNSARLNAFSDKEEAQLDREIYDKVGQATSKLKSCQTLLKAISSAQKETEQDQRLCQNMCKGLLVELQERARDLRTQQRNYLDRRRKLEGATKVSFLELAADQRFAEDYQEQLAEEQQMDLNLDSRNKQIMRLVESIHGLHEVYKQLSHLVVAQGTILDRIDYNIDQASSNVKAANTHLVQAVEHQKSPMARRCICILLCIVAVLGVLLVVKYTR